MKTSFLLKDGYSLQIDTEENADSKCFWNIFDDNGRGSDYCFGGVSSIYSKKLDDFKIHIKDEIAWMKDCRFDSGELMYSDDIAAFEHILTKIQ